MERRRFLMETFGKLYKDLNTLYIRPSCMFKVYDPKLYGCLMPFCMSVCKLLTVFTSTPESLDQNCHFFYPLIITKAIGGVQGQHEKTWGGGLLKIIFSRTRFFKLEQLFQ